jgi:hypothetical protein
LLEVLPNYFPSESNQSSLGLIENKQQYPKLRVGSSHVQKGSQQNKTCKSSSNDNGYICFEIDSSLRYDTLRILVFAENPIFE